MRFYDPDLPTQIPSEEGYPKPALKKAGFLKKDRLTSDWSFAMIREAYECEDQLSLF